MKINKYENISEIDIKKTIWHNSAGINNKNYINDEDENSFNKKYLEYWKLIKKDYEKLIDLRRGTNIELKESISSFDNEIDSFS